jgi:D-glycero-alpha-D-manno-heptose-7-phosphate kinase
MIVTKTPLRVSFFGGGSDLSQYYKDRPGLVVSTTIDKYIKIAVNKCEPKHVRVVYSELEQEDCVSKIKHTRARAVLERFDIKTSIEVASFSDTTTRGSGLGSSSSYTVGLIHALSELDKSNYTMQDLAEEACQIEINTLQEPIGKQDQYAAAFGGLNAIRFYSTGVEVTKVPIRSWIAKTLNLQLLCYSTGMTRSASSVLTQQVNNLAPNGPAVDATTRLVDMAEQSLKYLMSNKLNDFGALLHFAWEEKKKLSPGVSNQGIDEMYDTAIKAGALGGKVLGAGGGGYMLFYVPTKNQGDVSKAMRHYKRFDFEFVEQGSTVRSI